LGLNTSPGFWGSVGPGNLGRGKDGEALGETLNHKKLEGEYTATGSRKIQERKRGEKDSKHPALDQKPNQSLKSTKLLKKRKKTRAYLYNRSGTLQDEHKDEQQKNRR